MLLWNVEVGFEIQFDEGMGNECPCPSECGFTTTFGTFDFLLDLVSSCDVVESADGREEATLVCG